MEYALIGLLAVAVLVMLRSVHLLMRAFERFIEAHERFIQITVDERRELLNRYQFPERMPTKATGAARVQSNLSDEARRGLQQVGKVAPQVNDGD